MSHKNKTHSDALINPVLPTGIIFTIDGSVEREEASVRQMASVRVYIYPNEESESNSMRLYIRETEERREREEGNETSETL